MKATIIILHYRNVKDTYHCVNSIFKAIKTSVDFHILIVNNSPEQRQELIRMIPNDWYPTVEVIETGKNVGFAKGVNIAVRKALEGNVEKIAILNNDVQVPENFFDLFIHPNTIVVGPVIEFRSNEGKLLYDLGGSINWKTGRTKHSEVADTSQLPKTSIHVDYVSGCCMVIPRDVIKAVGLFDERFYFYFEDVDFCVRAKKLGFFVTVYPKVIVQHRLGGSIGRWSSQAIRYNLLGNYRFILKHLGIYRPVGIVYLSLLTAKIIYNRLRHEKS